jgi:HAMP domain-containing protein
MQRDSLLPALRVATPVDELTDHRRELEQKRIKREVKKALEKTTDLTRAVAEIEEYYRSLSSKGEQDEHR